MKTPAADITVLLQKHREGEEGALEPLFERVYGELKKMARAKMSKEKAGHTLQPTALVHEAFLRLFSGKEVDFKNRSHFFAVAANVIRRVLVDHARKKRASKRGGQAFSVTFEEQLVADGGRSPEDIVVLDDLLRQLAEVDARASRIVELRYFGGMSIEETAEALECSPDTVKRGWQKAKIWLFNAGEDHKKIA